MMSGMDILELPSLRIRFCLLPCPLPHGLLPGRGEEWAQAQAFCGGSVVSFMVHDAIGGCDRPFGAGAIDEL